MHFVIDGETETSCNYGEYHDHDGTIIINLLHVDSIETIIATILHEHLHELIDWAVYPDSTKPEQDHFIMPRLI